MGLKSFGRDISQETRAVREDLNDAKLWGKKKLKEYKKSKAERDRIKAKVKAMKSAGVYYAPKVSTAEKIKKGAKYVADHSVNNHVKDYKKSKRRLIYLESKIKSGKGTVEDSMKYRALKNRMQQIPIQAVSVAASKVTMATGLGAATAAIGAASNAPLAAMYKTVGSNASNRRLLKRVKEGKPLSPSERYRLAQAKKHFAKLQNQNKK